MISHKSIKTQYQTFDLEIIKSKNSWIKKLKVTLKIQFLLCSFKFLKSFPIYTVCEKKLSFLKSEFFIYKKIQKINVLKKFKIFNKESLHIFQNLVLFFFINIKKIYYKSLKKRYYYYLKNWKDHLLH